MGRSRPQGLDRIVRSAPQITGTFLQSRTRTSSRTSSRVGPHPRPSRRRGRSSRPGTTITNLAIQFKRSDQFVVRVVLCVGPVRVLRGDGSGVGRRGRGAATFEARLAQGATPDELARRSSTSRSRRPNGDGAADRPRSAAGDGGVPGWQRACGPAVSMGSSWTPGHQWEQRGRRATRMCADVGHRGPAGAHGIPRAARALTGPQVAAILAVAGGTIEKVMGALKNAAGTGVGGSRLVPPTPSGPSSSPSPAPPAQCPGRSGMTTMRGPVERNWRLAELDELDALVRDGEGTEGE